MKQIPLTLLLLLIGISSLQAQKVTVSGYVQDESTGEKLIGAKVFDPVLKIGALTNNYGFFSISVNADSLRLTCTYLGYQPAVQIISLQQDTSINFKLGTGDLELDAVEITAEETVVESAQMSTIDVPVEMIKKLPALLGEVDVIKTLQLLPGVQSGSEGSSGLYVRGGGPDQNLILLDGVPVYNVSHLFGFFSVFNADAIKNVTLIKGGFPARYGGRLSSVLEINMKEGDQQKFHGEGMVGIVASKLTLEGPISKGKTSFLVSGRRTYIDLLARPLIKAATDGDAAGGYYFYDLNGKVNHTFSDKDRLFFSVYNGKDRFFARENYQESVPGMSLRTENEFGINWGNSIAALRWNHLFSSKLFANFTGTFSNYNFGVSGRLLDERTENGVTSTESSEISYDSGIRDFSAKADFDWFADPNHLVRFGAYGIRHRFTPGITGIRVEDDFSEIDTSFGGNVTNAWELGTYIEDDLKLGSRIKANLGVHASAFLVNKRFYYSVQPRFSGRYLINDEWAVKGSFAAMTQYIHLLSNTNVGLPTDLWVPATDRIRPQSSLQGAIGVAKVFREQGFEVSVEGYYKTMDNVLEYSEGASFLSGSSDWEELVEQGDAWSYGAEMLVQKKTGKTTGWVGYTLSWTNRQFENLNNGKIYPYRYDRRHDLSIVVTHKFSDRIDVGATWVYGSGYAVTLPVARIAGLDPDPLSRFGFPSEVDYVDEKNSFRMPDYHRLDLGVNFHKQKKHWERTWTVSVYNAYNRQNAFFLFFDDALNGGRALKQVSLFPILPSVSYKFKF